MHEKALSPPPDKSISHRALILASLSSGATVFHLNPGRDVSSTGACLRGLGVAVEGRAERVRIRGPVSPASPPGPLDCGNSGTTLRVLAGLIAGWGVRASLDGDASLRKRPADRVMEPLERAGARFAAREGRFPPLRVLRGITGDIFHDSPVASAQVKTSLLVAGLAGQKSVVCSEPHPSRDHTERLLAWLDQDITVGHPIAFTPRGPLPGFALRVPGDPSGAAFFVALALMRGLALRVEDVCLNPTRMGFYSILKRMGARLWWEILDEAPEPVGRIMVEPGANLEGTTVERGEVASAIDELPLLGVLASVVQGDVVVRGAGELRLKESDRIGLLVKNLRARGARVEEFPDGFRVQGPFRFQGGLVDTGRDHRMAMAFCVAGAAFSEDVRLDDPSAPEVSYPGFYEDLRRMLS